VSEPSESSDSRHLPTFVALKNRLLSGGRRLSAYLRQPRRWSRDLLLALRFEHLLLVLFLGWAVFVVRDWYKRLGDAYFNTNVVGLSWVAAPALLLIGVVIVQQLAAWAARRETGAAPGGRHPLMSALGAGLYYFFLPIHWVMGLVFPRDKAEAATAHDPWKLLAKPLEVVADWLPFFLFLSIYLMFRGEPMQKLQGDNCDALLAAWEEMIFRGHASLWLEKYASIWLTLTMQYLYSLHIWFTTPAAAILCYMKDRKLLRALMLAMTVVAGLGAVGYITLPGAGPGRYLHDQYKGDLPVTRMGQALDYSIATSRAPDDVFPSLHVGISMVCLIEVRRTWKRWFWILLPFILGNWASTIYLRYHYVIDDVAGIALAVFACWFAHGVIRLEDWVKRRFANHVSVSAPVSVEPLNETAA
jgi:hypothetical protein